MECSRKQKQENKGKEDSNLIKQKCKIEDIKSKCVIKKVFANLSKKNLFEIVKYNKEGNEEKNAVRTDKIRAPEYICGT